MSLSALLIVLLAAGFHATWNFLIKKLNGGPELIWLFSVVSLVLYFPVLLYFLVAVEMAFGVTETVLVLGSGLLHLSYFLLLQTGYRHGELSLVYPVARATGPLLATLFAVVILGEAASRQVIAGGLCIIVGVLFLTGGVKSKGKSKTPSLLFGLATGVLIGCYTVLDAYSVAVVLISPLVLDYISNAIRGIALMPYSLQRMSTVRSLWAKHPIEILTIALLSPLAYIMVLYVYTYTPVVYVAPVREVSVLFTVILGAVLLKESDLKSRLVWGVLIVAGIGLLVTG
jgi:drug/metabolite transporter (DMT)-like permease